MNNNLEPRHAARTVLIDNQGQVAVVHAQKSDYYKIPGGGVESGEDVTVAAEREASEESGCHCQILANLGTVETPLPGWQMFDISTGFLAKVIGKPESTNFSDLEASRKFAIEWFPSLENAIDVISTHDPDLTEGPEILAMQTRDLEFLRRAAKVLTDQPEIFS